MKTKLAPKNKRKRPLVSRRRHRVRNVATLAGNATENIIQILWQDQVLHLKEPIDLTVREEGGEVLIAYRPLGLEGFGADRFEALECFANQFAVESVSTRYRSVLVLRKSARPETAGEAIKPLGNELVAKASKVRPGLITIVLPCWLQK